MQGVNGPPGTGKTTLLKDVIAEIIVERAKIISDLGCDGLFEKGYQKIEKESGYDRYTYNLKKSLKNNFGIVVASNNNAAVENISKELPLKEKIDSQTFPDADYFSVCSQSLIDDDSWGALAAALGNVKNRAAFRKAFWQPDKDIGQIGFHDLLHNIYKDPNDDEKKMHSEAFNAHNELFKNLLWEFDNFKKQASLFHKLLPNFIKNKKKENLLVNELAEIGDNLSKLSLEKTTLLEKEETTKRDADRAQPLLQLQLRRKPIFFFIQKLFSTSSYRQWNSETEELMNQLKTIERSLISIRRELEINSDKTQNFIVKEKNTKSDLFKLDAFFSNYRTLQNILYKEYEIDNNNIFDIHFQQKDLEKVHLLNPYHSKKVAKLRSDIFITALQLHQDAILANAKNIKNNLAAFFEMLSGWITVKKDISQNLWDTFFLCVPVVSTTLASASRLFPNIDKNQIGWLLIDEAGQATPQSVAGLIHRSKRCVIVGDPLQVEPVVTMPEKLVTK